MSVSKNTKLNLFWELCSPIFVSFILYIGIRIFLIEARYIPSGSMLPGLKIKDRIVVEKLTLNKRSPFRGEIVVFNSPYSFDPKLMPAGGMPKMQCMINNIPFIALLPGLISPACDAYIKRVIAVSGDEFLINNKGEVFINGYLKEEPYVQYFCNKQSTPEGACRSLKGVVPSSHVLVLGDNRENSWDSRYWPGISYLPERHILGRAVWRYWPLNRLGPLNL